MLLFLMTYLILTGFVVYYATKRGERWWAILLLSLFFSPLVAFLVVFLFGKKSA